MVIYIFENRTRERQHILFFLFFLFFLIKLSRYGCMVDYEMGHNFSSRDCHMFNHERGNNFHLVTVTWSKTREGTIFCYKYIFHHGRGVVGIPYLYISRELQHFLLQIHFSYGEKSCFGHPKE